MSADEPDSAERPLTQRELLITINGKLDVFALELKGLGTQGADHEARLRRQEDAHYVTWKQFWGGVVGAATAAGALASFIPNIHIT